MLDQIIVPNAGDVILLKDGLNAFSNIGQPLLFGVDAINSDLKSIVNNQL
jgi:hypothetical protein